MRSLRNVWVNPYRRPPPRWNEVGDIFIGSIGLSKTTYRKRNRIRRRQGLCHGSNGQPSDCFERSAPKELHRIRAKNYLDRVRAKCDGVVSCCCWNIFDPPSFVAYGSANGRCVPGEPNSSLLCSTSSRVLPEAFRLPSLRRECGVAPMAPAQ